MNFLDIVEAKKIYKEGGNIMKYLRKKFNTPNNTSQIIEIAYDLQTGSYIDYVNSNPKKAQSYAKELSYILKSHLVSGDTLLDVGTGEITTLTFLLNNIDIDLSSVLAFDISWSRLSKGMQFHKDNKKTKISLITFVADIKEIPLHANCVDVVTSNHALEPNGKNLGSLLNDLFRITKKKLVLFEPSYELNSGEGKARMDSLGYIKDIEGEVAKLGGKLLDIIPIINVDNPLNPTACYVIEPPKACITGLDEPMFCVPGTNLKLKRNSSFLFSEDTGLVFPILDGIPILRTKSAILATAKF